MSIYSKDKCTKEEIDKFKKTVVKYLTDNGIDVSKIKMRCQRNYDGNIIIITHKSKFTNKKISVRKDAESPTGYSRGIYSQTVSMGVYFYRTEWKDYLGGDESQELIRDMDLIDIKKVNNS